MGPWPSSTPCVDLEEPLPVLEEGPSGPGARRLRSEKDGESSRTWLEALTWDHLPQGSSRVEGGTEVGAWGEGPVIPSFRRYALELGVGETL